MTELDERWVARAVAETLKSLIKGERRLGLDPLSVENAKQFLYYHINPYATTGSFDMLKRICDGLEASSE